MKSVRKALSVLLVVVMVCACVPVCNYGTLAGAAQSCADNFRKLYMLTGDAANDMTKIALAQYGRIGSELGYEEDWNTDFIYDCAVLANQTDVIAQCDSAQELKDKLIEKGGYEVTAAKPGDICFVNWNKGKGIEQAEIVYSVYGTDMYTIGGDSGNASSYSLRYVNKHAPISSSYVVSIVRPNYNCKKVVDVAFLIDTTSSMQSDIDVLKSNMTDYIKKLDDSQLDYRIAIVDYRDFATRSHAFEDYAYSVVSNFLTNSFLIQQKVNSLSLGNGGDDPETVYSGIIDGLSALKWRSEAGKMVILMGDAPAHDPEPTTGYTFNDAADFLNGKRGEDSYKIHLFAIATAQASVELFTKLANATGGVAYTAEKPEDVDATIEKIIDNIPESVPQPAPAQKEDESKDDTEKDEGGNKINGIDDITGLFGGGDDGSANMVVDMIMNFMKLVLQLFARNPDSAIGSLISGNEDIFDKMLETLTNFIGNMAKQ